MKGAEQPVENDRDLRKVLVDIFGLHAVMGAVVGGGGDELLQDAELGDIVGVVEDAVDRLDGVHAQEHRRRQAQEGKRHGAEEQDDIAVDDETARRHGKVEFVRRVVNLVEGPEQADPVTDAMVDIVADFMGDEGQRDRGDEGQRPDQAPMVVDPNVKHHRRDTADQEVEGVVDAVDDDIVQRVHIVIGAAFEQGIADPLATDHQEVGGGEPPEPVVTAHIVDEGADRIGDLAQKLLHDSP